MADENLAKVAAEFEALLKECRLSSKAEALRAEGYTGVDDLANADDGDLLEAGLKKPEIKVRQISAGAPPNLRWSSARAPLVALEAPLISTDLRWPPAGHPYSRGRTHPSPCVRSRARAAAPYCAGVDRRRGALGAEA